MRLGEKQLKLEARKEVLFLQRQKKQKKAQVTIFIIIGIVLLISAAAIFYFSNKGNSIVPSVNLVGSDKLQANFDSCLKTTSLNGLKLLGNQGGYIQVPQLILFQGTSFWYMNQANIQPTLGDMTKNLEEYVDENLPKCMAFSDFEEQGYELTKGTPKTQVIFGKENTIVNVEYLIEAKKGAEHKKYERFTATLDVRTRKIFETSSKIISNQLNPAFKFSNPLEGVNDTNFKLGSKNFENEILYTVTDDKIKENNEPFVFTFASQFKMSDLKRTVNLQNNSNSVFVVFPLIVYSLDRKAQLILMPGTTMVKEGRSVPSISVQQSYPNAVSRNVPMTENADDSVTYGDITWTIKYPVYNFEPTGLKFNQPQRLVIYWDEDRIPHKDKMGIIVNEGDGWTPLPSQADYEKHYVYSDIAGFSNFTLADCGDQKEKEVSATAKIDPGMTCFIKLIVIAAVIAGAAAAAILFAGTGAFSATALVGGDVVGAGFFTGTGEILGGLAAMSAETGMVGLTALGITTAAAIGLVGGVAINGATAYEAAKDQISFTATCEQSSYIDQSLENGQGKCEPEAGKKEIKAGEKVTITAQLKKCNMLKTMMCGKCSLKCSAKYK